MEESTKKVILIPLRVPLGVHGGGKPGEKKTNKKTVSKQPEKAGGPKKHKWLALMEMTNKDSAAGEDNPNTHGLNMILDAMM